MKNRDDIRIVESEEALTTAMTNNYQKISEVMPGGVNSPVRSCKGLLSEPFMVQSGKDDILVDVNGKYYLDYCNSWGAIIHGHAHPVIIEAVKKRMEQGTSFGITCPIEEKLARKIINNIDSIELIRFVSSGTEATMSAIRLARGYTGRSKIIKFTGNYHGHADHLLVKAGSGVMGLPESSSAGVPKEFISQTICLPYNDSEAFIAEMNETVAAVILEPVAGNMGVVPASQEFIDVLRQETEKYGAVLIFDEVMTGFRLGLNGAQGLYGVEADLTCLGKVIGGGFNVAAFGGKKEIMKLLAPLGNVYQAGTLSGNPIAMEAGYQALKLCEEPGFYDRLENKTNQMAEPVRDAIETYGLDACLQQAGSMVSLFFGLKNVRSFEDVQKVDRESFSQFFRYMFDHGIYLPPSYCEAWFLSDALSEEHLDQTTGVILAFLEKWRNEYGTRST